jgi:hypothetical protein
MHAELVEQRVQTPALERREARHLHVDRIELLLRCEAVGRRLNDAGRDLTPNAGDANHVELVEIPTEDAEKFYSLQQRHPRIERFMQHARVERQPAELAIEVE